MAVKPLGRAVQKIIRTSMKDNTDWEVATPAKEARKVVDIIIGTKQCDAIVKVKTTAGRKIKYSTFTEDQLSVLSRYWHTKKRNISLVFIYFGKDSQLVSIDIHKLLQFKSGELELADLEGYGYFVRDWESFGQYLNNLRKTKGPVSNDCDHHHWLIESPEEAMVRYNRRIYSMGVCKYCGDVRTKFKNVLEPLALQL